MESTVNSLCDSDTCVMSVVLSKVVDCCCDRVVWSAGVWLLSYRDQLPTAVMIAVLLLALLLMTVIFLGRASLLKDSNLTIVFKLYSAWA
jgi:hypothetical protein